MSVLKKRLKALETTSGEDRGCERCRGLLVTVSHAITGVPHSATWSGEAISKGEHLELRTEARCPGCGRELNPEEAPVIWLGGQG